MFETVVRCNLCGGDRFERIHDHLEPTRFAGPGGTFQLVRCLGCDLVLLSPRPSREVMPEYYSRAFYASLSPEAAKGSRAPRLLTRSYLALFPPPNRRRLSACLRIVQALGPGEPGRLLDVGAGEGAFLEAMQHAGWQVSGTDVSPDAARMTARRLGISLLVGPFEELTISGDEYDLVTFWDVLEHLHDPLGALRKARNLLRPGGKVLVSVPNLESLEARWLGQAWPHLDVPRHLTHFTAQTLGRMLLEAGFDQVQTRTDSRLLTGNLLAGRLERHARTSTRPGVRRAARVGGDVLRFLLRPTHIPLERAGLAQALVGVGQA